MGGKAEGRSRGSDEGRDGVLILRAGDAYVDVLGSRGLELGLGEGNVGFRGDTAFKTYLCQLQILFVGLNGVIEELLLGIEAAHLEIIGG
jgi:hypothetical protein